MIVMSFYVKLAFLLRLVGPTRLILNTIVNCSNSVSSVSLKLLSNQFM